MKIGYISDLHLEVWDRHHGSFNGKRMSERIVDSIYEQAHDHGVDLLMFAGDMVDGIEDARGGYAHNKFGAVGNPWQYIWVMGNHDFFGHKLMDDCKIFDGGLTVAATTLWTDCHDNLASRMWFHHNMPDAIKIKNFKLAEMLFLHGEQKRFIFSAKPDVVMTHNPPSMQSVGPNYRDFPIQSNQAFMPELGNEIAASNIKLWICGHVHHKHEYMIGDTKVVCNPLGTIGERFTDPLNYEIGIEEIN
jgi:Icc-related predicted phosphoesterase